MSGGATGPNQSFRERLERVAVNQAPAQEVAPVTVLPDIKSSFSGKFALFAAFLVGLIAVMVVRIARFHISGEAMIGGNADMTLAIETAAALVVSFVLFALCFRFKGTQYKFVQFFGVFLMISMMHNAVHSAPGVFNAMFSPEWTAAVTEQTAPNSLYLRGEVIPFVKEPEEEKKLPVVRRG